jgi:hypothetical protein
MNTRQNSGQWIVVSGQFADMDNASRVAPLPSPASGLRSSSLATSHQPLTTRGVPRRAPRGVLLLVVLSLLVLFTLIGVTFVLVASQSRRATRADSRHEQYGDNPQRVLDAVFGQIVRDTTNVRSSLQGHSLLADMYGPSPIAGTIDGAIVSAQTITIDVTPDKFTAVSVKTPLGRRVATMSNQPGYYNGCVFTVVFRDSKQPNISTRILGYTPGPIGGFGEVLSGRFIVMALDGASAVPSSVDRFVVNGRPFSGAGIGYNAGEPYTDTSNNGQYDLLEPFMDLNGNGVRDAGTGLLDLAAPGGRLFALLPHANYSSYLLGPDGIAGNVDDGLLVPNEDYDAPDLQNMLLAYMPITLPAAPPTIANPSPILPSLHRPDLVNYYATTLSAAWSNPAVARQVMLRPLGQMKVSNTPYPAASLDHPNFTGSNPDFDAVVGPWDVDNDGDGVADSIWVDVGMPVQTAPDGRRFKPLAAILCLDLDGRLNVNAHGSLANVDASFAAPGNPFAMPPDARYSLASSYASNPISYGLGQGYGTADISLAGLFTSAATYRNLMTGDGTGRLGRYGATTTGLPFPAFPGVSTQESALSLLKHFEYPVANYPAGVPSYPNVLMAFANPPDLWCRGFTALDVRGTPLMPGLGVDGDTLNNPYDFNLNRTVVRSATTAASPANYPVDAPFTAAELERILRLYDVDANLLPDRLRVLLDTGVTLPITRGRITTDSFDLPSPSFLAPSEVRAANPATSGSQHIVDLLHTRYPALTVAQISTLLPGEVVSGLRLDVNRPFGNGRDDNNNGVVDEPAEASSPEYVWFSPRGPTAPPTPAAVNANFSTIRFDHNNDGVYTAADLIARQLYAKHLYVLMMLLKPPGIEIDFDGDPSNNLPQETARGLAQWSINVVDFRDRDSIMTPFEYTVDPFATGWTADGDITATGAGEGVVWGCERPELLITETIAFHDRRSEDLPNDNHAGPNTDPGDQSPGKVSGVSPSKDSDYDQRLVPLGSFFVELYNPWHTHSSTLNPDGTPNTIGYPSVREAPGEFYDVKNNNVTGLQLNRRAPDASGNTFTTGSPVWRLLVVKGPVALNNERKDPDDPDPTKRPTANFPPLITDDVERSVYFVDITTCTTALSLHGTPYYSLLPIDPILPGQYAVVGSPGYVAPAGSNNYITPIGRPNTWTAATETAANYSAFRRLELHAGIGAPSNRVQIFNNGATEPYPIEGSGGPPAGVQPAVAAIIDQPRPLSISEPTGTTEPYYDTYGAIISLGVETAFSAVIDAPIDQQRAVAYPIDFGALGHDGTTANFRTVHLQRLANPMTDWNTQTNPYLTVDTMSVDLTVFNGVEYQSVVPDPKLGPSTLNGFASLQRGDNDPLNVPISQNNLWRHETPNLASVATQSVALSPNVFKFFLQHTLGYLNKFAAPIGPTNASSNTFATGNPHGPQYVGSPNVVPFPWLTWNNRPFVGATELMLVPKSRSSRLLYEYNYNATVAPVYSFPGPPPPTQLTSGFGHFLSFFQSQATPTGAPHFYRLLEYLSVPSRFVGTETVLNPSPPVPGFYPPFNKVSNYREPGRVNINTIPSDTLAGGSSAIWTGIMNGAPDPGFQTIVASRRGYGAAGSPEFQANPNAPSYFSNPFRGSGGASLTISTLTGLPPRKEVDVTLLRPSDPPTATENPLFSFTSANAYDNTTRNPYFRYQDHIRLSNLLTTRSNVYAVWVTVGYFEVSVNPGGVDAGHPDGFVLGQEIGSETGEIKRPRAFYIYDRSIPVGFEPGKDHNIDQGTLIKRFIE